MSSDSETDVPTSQDSAGSLRDFVVDDSESECSSHSDSASESEPEPDDQLPSWIDRTNIVAGPRRRRAPKSIYEDLREEFDEVNYAEDESGSDSDESDADCSDSGVSSDSSDFEPPLTPPLRKRRRLIESSSDEDER